MLEGHISRAFDGALASLHIRVVEMGGLVLDQVREAAAAYTEWLVAPAQHVLEREAEVNEYNTRLNEEQVTLIARRQPVAGDLRAIIAMTNVVARARAGGRRSEKDRAHGDCPRQQAGTGHLTRRSPSRQSGGYLAAHGARVVRSTGCRGGG